MPAGSGKLIGESRDLQKKLASFFCLNLRTGEVLWEGAQFGEAWWIGIEAVRNDTLLLHLFAHPDLPEHRAVIAVDVRTGTELWRNDEVTFRAAGVCGVLVSRRPALVDEQLQLDYRTGEVLERDVTPWTTEDDEETILPVPLYDDDDDDQKALLLRHQDAQTLVWPVDMIERDQVIIYNYHTKHPDFTDEAPHLNSILAVIEKTMGSILFRDTICGNARMVVPNAFLVSGGMLLYVHERTALTAVDVSTL